MSDDAAKPEEVPPPVPEMPAPRFEVSPFQPDGGAPPGGLALLLGGMLMAAVVLGFLTSMIAQWFYLVLVFPFGLGMALGAAGAVLVYKGRIRNPMLACLAGLLGGVLLMGSMHYFDYIRLQRKMQAALGGAAVNLNGFTFLHYIDFMAKQGVTIGKVGQKNPINLGYYGSIIYWAVEAAIVAGCAAAMTRSRTFEPYCSACGVWKEEKPLVTLAGADSAAATAAVLSGELARILPHSLSPQPTGLLVKVAACPHCGADGTVDVQLANLAANDKGEVSTKKLAQVTYPGAMLTCLEESADNAET